MILWIDRDEFLYEFGDLRSCKGVVVDIGQYEYEEELYNDRILKTYTVDYVVFEYFVNGFCLRNSCNAVEKDYRIDEIVDIEYSVFDNSVSKIRGEFRYRFNFFIRNLIFTSAISFFVLMCVLFIVDFLNFSDKFS